MRALLTEALAAKGYTIEVNPEYTDGRLIVRLNGLCVFAGFPDNVWRWLENDRPAPLDREKIRESVEWNRANPSRQFSYTVPLPNWDSPLHIGAQVRSKSRNRNSVYTVVDIFEDYAVIVPVCPIESPAVCAYTRPIESLEVVEVTQ